MKQKTIRRYKFTHKRIQFIVRAIIRVWRMHTHHEINYFIQSESSRSYMINPVNLIFPQPTAIRDPWTIIFPREMFDNALINGEFAIRTLLT